MAGYYSWSLHMCSVVLTLADGASSCWLTGDFAWCVCVAGMWVKKWGSSYWRGACTVQGWQRKSGARCTGMVGKLLHLCLHCRIWPCLAVALQLLWRKGGGVPCYLRCALASRRLRCDCLPGVILADGVALLYLILNMGPRFVGLNRTSVHEKLMGKAMCRHSHCRCMALVSARSGHAMR